MSESRGSTWEDNEVILLIDIWKIDCKRWISWRYMDWWEIQHQLDTCTRKKPIWEKMARMLKGEGGFCRSFVQIKEKIMQLKHKYKKVKHNNWSGRSRRTFLFFDKLAWRGVEAETSIPLQPPFYRQTLLLNKKRTTPSL